MTNIKYRLWDKCEESMIGIKKIGLNEDGSFWYVEAWDDDVPYFEDKMGETFEIMSYTGLKDKKGVEIYEGDLVIGGEFNSYNFSIINSEATTVKYKNGMFKAGGLSLCTINRKCVVVGNIHSNPELQKETD